MFPQNSIGKRLGILLLALTAFMAHAQSKEYQIKATFIYNFAQFVEWPTNTFTSAEAPFCIGILGDDPFGNFLDVTVQGEKIGGHPLVVQRYHQAGEVQNCQILFVSHSEAERFQEDLAGLKSKSVLTVGDTAGFCKDGGIVRFVTEENKVHFRINPAAAKNAKLTVNSKLLRLAEIVQPGED